MRLQVTFLHNEAPTTKAIIFAIEILKVLSMILRAKVVIFKGQIYLEINLTNFTVDLLFSQSHIELLFRSS